jgi:hypothetical protein
VCSSTNQAITPIIKDLRVIALKWLKIDM